MFLQIIEMLLGNVFVTLVSIKLFRIIRSKVNHLDIAIFGFIWIYITTLYTLILGIFGLLESHKIAIISIIGLVILLSLSYKNLKHPRLWFDSLTSLHFPRMSLIGIILCILAFLQLARIIVHIWYIPPVRVGYRCLSSCQCRRMGAKGEDLSSNNTCWKSVLAR